MDDLQQRIERTARQLHQAATEFGMFISADGRVSEVAAAELVGYAAGTLRNMRTAGGGPAFFNRALGGCSKSYRLNDLAHWLEQAREETI